jgi:hypothetical protein
MPRPHGPRRQLGRAACSASSARWLTSTAPPRSSRLRRASCARQLTPSSPTYTHWVATGSRPGYSGSQPGRVCVTASSTWGRGLDTWGCSLLVRVRCSLLVRGVASPWCAGLQVSSLTCSQPARLSSVTPLRLPSTLSPLSVTPAQRAMCRRESGAPTAQAMSMATSPQRVSSRHRSCSAWLGLGLGVGVGVGVGVGGGGGGGVGVGVRVRHRSCSACMGIKKPTAWSVSLLQPRKETTSRRVHRRSSRSAWCRGKYSHGVGVDGASIVSILMDGGERCAQ